MIADVRRENEMKDKMKVIWFPAKKYGFGWELPIAWQGCILLLIYIFLTLTGSVMLSNFSKTIIRLILYILILTILFACVEKKARK